MKSQVVTKVVEHTFTFTDEEMAQMYWDLKWIFDTLALHHINLPAHFTLSEFYQQVNAIKISQIRQHGKWE